MGGLALKNAYTRRYQRDEFEVISQEMTEILEKDFARVGIPLYYKNKESFGDIDIVVDSEGFNKNMREYIEETFKPTEIYHNGNCWSFDYKEIQVDIMTVSQEHYESYYTYLCYNDMSNLIGRLAHMMGLKFGQEGLWLNYYYGGNQKDKILISKDMERVLKLLDLDYDKYLQGFDELSDIFDFIGNSKYFNYDSYQYHNLNKINRERNLKRKSYVAFLEYIEKFKDKLYKFDGDTIDIIREHFPEINIDLKIAELNFEYAKKALVKAKFSGREIMRRFDVKGAELGKLIDSFKEFIICWSDHKDFDSYVLAADSVKIYNTLYIFKEWGLSDHLRSDLIDLVKDSY